MFCCRHYVFCQTRCSIGQGCSRQSLCFGRRHGFRKVVTRDAELHDDRRRNTDQTQKGEPDRPHRLWHDHAYSPRPSRSEVKLVTKYEGRNAVLKRLPISYPHQSPTCAVLTECLLGNAAELSRSCRQSEAAARRILASATDIADPLFVLGDVPIEGADS